MSTKAKTKPYDHRPSTRGDKGRLEPALSRSAPFTTAGEHKSFRGSASPLWLSLSTEENHARPLISPQHSHVPSLVRNRLRPYPYAILQSRPAPLRGANNVQAAGDLQQAMPGSVVHLRASTRAQQLQHEGEATPSSPGAYPQHTGQSRYSHKLCPAFRGPDRATIVHKPATLPHEPCLQPRHPQHCADTSHTDHIMICCTGSVL